VNHLAVRENLLLPSGMTPRPCVSRIDVQRFVFPRDTRAVAASGCERNYVIARFKRRNASTGSTTIRRPHGQGSKETAPQDPRRKSKGIGVGKMPVAFISPGPRRI